MRKKDLEKRIKELESLVLEQRQIIEDLKLQINNQPYIPTYPQPNDDHLKPPFIVECDHDFPSPWWGTTPPACKKCGELAQMVEVRWGHDTGNPPWDMNEHGGNILTIDHTKDLALKTNSVTQIIN